MGESASDAGLPPLALPTSITIDRAGGGEFVATLAGRTVTAGSLRELLEEIYDAFEEEDDLRAASAAREEVAREGAIPWDQVKKDLGI